MVLSHQGYQLKSTSTPSRGTPYVSRCAAVLTRDSTCCAQLLLCVLWLQESFSHMALWVAVQLRRSQHRPIHFKGRWFWDQDRPSQDWAWVMTKIARSNIHSHKLVNTRHWKPVWDGLISAQSSMKDWTNKKMGNDKKWICNVPCLGIVRSLTGGSSHPSWLRLLFGVSSVLFGSGLKPVFIYLFVGFGSLKKNPAVWHTGVLFIFAAPTPPAGAGSCIFWYCTHIYRDVHL